MFTFEVEKISKFRTELMGVATLLVLLVHAYDNGVVMPSYLQEVCKLGSLGVDIFLLVSGLGLWFSLSSFYGGCEITQPDHKCGGGKTLVFKEIQKDTCAICLNLYTLHDIVDL